MNTPLAPKKGAGAPEIKSFEISPQMIQAGVEIYFGFDPEKDEPETLVANILFKAKTIWEGKNTP